MSAVTTALRERGLPLLDTSVTESETASHNMTELPFLSDETSTQAPPARSASFTSRGFQTVGDMGMPTPGPSMDSATAGIGYKVALVCLIVPTALKWIFLGYAYWWGTLWAMDSEEVRYTVNMSKTWNFELLFWFCTMTVCPFTVMVHLWVTLSVSAHHFRLTDGGSGDYERRLVQCADAVGQLTIQESLHISLLIGEAIFFGLFFTVWNGNKISGLWTSRNTDDTAWTVDWAAAWLIKSATPILVALLSYGLARSRRLIVMCQRAGTIALVSKALRTMTIVLSIHVLVLMRFAGELFLVDPVVPYRELCSCNTTKSLDPVDKITNPWRCEVHNCKPDFFRPKLELQNKTCPLASSATLIGWSGRMDCQWLSVGIPMYLSICVGCYYAALGQGLLYYQQRPVDQHEIWRIEWRHAAAGMFWLLATCAALTQVMFSFSDYGDSAVCVPLFPQLLGVLFASLVGVMVVLWWDGIVAAVTRRAAAGQSTAKWQLGAGKRYATFLSHYKAQASLPARYVKDKLTERLHADVFLDSDYLFDLRTLLEEIPKADVLLVFLTRDFLTRPW